MEAKRRKYASEIQLTREQCAAEPQNPKDEKKPTSVKIQPGELHLQTSISDSSVSSFFTPMQGTINVDVSGDGGFVSLTIDTKPLYSRLGISTALSPGAPKAICSAVKLDRVSSSAGDSSSPTTVYSNHEELHESQVDHNRTLETMLKTEFQNLCFYGPNVFVDAAKGREKTNYVATIAYRESGLMTARFKSVETESITGEIIVTASKISERLTKALNATEDESLEECFDTFTDTVCPATDDEQDWKLQPVGKGVFKLLVKLPDDCFTDGDTVFVQITRLSLKKRV